MSDTPTLEKIQTAEPGSQKLEFKCDPLRKNELIGAVRQDGLYRTQAGDLCDIAVELYLKAMEKTSYAPEDLSKPKAYTFSDAIMDALLICKELAKNNC